MPTYICTISVTDPATKQTRLVEAKNQAKTLAHVAESHITIDKATSAQLVELGAAGVKIESAAA